MKNKIRYDTQTEIRKWFSTPQGYLRVPATISRGNCILTYKTVDGKEVKEFRPEEEVAKIESLETAKSLPILKNKHVMININNPSIKTDGITSDIVEYKDDLIYTELIVTNLDTIKAIQDKKLVDISPGYICDVEQKSGEYNGKRFDSIQRNIVYNHIGLLPKNHGRQGSRVGIRMDSEGNLIVMEGKKSMSEKKENSGIKVSLRFDNQDIVLTLLDESPISKLHEIEKRFDSLQLMEKQVEELTGELKGVKKNLEEAEKNLEHVQSTEHLDSLVEERLSIIEKAKSIKSDLDFKKTNQEIKLDTLEAFGLSKDEFKDSFGNFSPTLIDGAFKVLKNNNNNNITGIITDPKKRVEIKTDSIDQKSKMNDRIKNRWKLGDQQGGQ